MCQILNALLYQIYTLHDSLWPVAFVCEVLEAVLPSETLAKAVVFERRRMLGAHWLDENGMASRKDGERYREWEERLGESYPFLWRLKF